jgi:hypothetical protein
MLMINPFVFGGGGAPAFPSIANIWDWYEPSREGLSDNAPIGTLTGQANARNFAQTGSERPIYKENIVNGVGCSRHEGGTSGVHYYWNGPNMSALTAAHCFIVVKFDLDCPGTSMDTALWQMGTDGSNGDHHPWNDCVWYDGAFSTARKTTGNPTANTTSWRVVEVVSTSSEWTMLFDGTSHFTTATNTVGARNGPRLGRNGGNDSFKGYMAGLYVFSAKLTTDRATLITYINNRFGLSSS